MHSGKVRFCLIRFQMADPTPSTSPRPVFKRYSALENLNEVINDDDSDQGDFEDPLSNDFDEEETDSNLHHPLLVEAMGDDDMEDPDYQPSVSGESESEGDPDYQYRPSVVDAVTSKIKIEPMILDTATPRTAPPPVVRGRGRGVSKRRVSPKGKTSRRGCGRRTGRGLHPSDLVREWKPADAHPPNPHVSFTAHPGIKVNVAHFSPVDYMQLFFNNDLISHLVEQTNLYADQFLEAHPNLPEFSRANLWEPVDAEEMKKFLGLVLLMGIVRLPSICLYWSTKIIFRQSAFGAVMTRNRFEIILQFLHFHDNTTMPPRGDPLYDRLYKIRPVLDHLQEKFQEVYEPRQAVCVDESLLLWKGRLIFRQYIPRKHAQYGIKLYLCCESDGQVRGSGGYCYRFKVYAGKEDPVDEMEPVLDVVDANNPNLSASEKMVLYLIAPLLNKGYHVYMDSFYSSLRLYLYLLEKNTLACGTVRESRGIPQELHDEKPAPGCSVAVCGDGRIVATKYHSTRVVHLLSTVHGHTETAVQDTQQRGVNKRPQVSTSCSRNMGGVHKQNQLVQPYDCTRKSMKWTKKLFFHFLQVAACNAFILSKSDENSPKCFLDFMDSLICSWLFPDNLPAMEDCKVDDEVRLTARHFLYPLPPTAKKAHPQKPCRVCSKRLKIRRDTTYHCPYCPSKPALCYPQCFVDYHTKFKYWQ